MLITLASILAVAGAVPCGDPRPHQSTLWGTNFPNKGTGIPSPQCDGSIEVKDDGTICVDGRVTYGQIAKAVGKPVYAPAYPTITITGHLVSGSGNLVLGPRVGFLYDFVKSYTVDGVEYETNSTSITDNLLAASRGTIDGVCLDSSFARDPETYSISTKFFKPKKVDVGDLADVSVIYVSYYSVVAEYHRLADKKPSFLGKIKLALFNLSSSIPLPAFLLNLIKPFFSFTGLLRFFSAGGRVSTADFPQPLLAAFGVINNVQIDTEWETLMTAMKQGLFTKDKLPLFAGSVIKRVVPSDNPNGCWTVPVASIDVQVSPNRGDELDRYIENTLYPALINAGGTVSMHFGKRIPAPSSLLQSALDKYASCGAELDLAVDLDQCYHPLCNRANAATSFTYPSAYYS